MSQHIACSSNNSFAINKEGKVYVWGSCDSGLLGTESDKHKETPYELEIKYGFTRIRQTYIRKLQIANKK